MARKKEFSNPIRVSILIESDSYELIKKEAIKLSMQVQRQITPTEYIRSLVERNDILKLNTKTVA